MSGTLSARACRQSEAQGVGGVLCTVWAQRVCYNTELFSAFITKALSHESQKIL